MMTADSIVKAVSTLVIAIVLAWALASAQSRIEDQDLYADTADSDMRLLELDKQALDEAYHQQLIKLWGVWLQGGAQDPKYFQTGLANARRAYNHAAKQISEREKILLERQQQQPR